MDFNCTLILFKGLSTETKELIRTNKYFSKNNKHFFITKDNTIVEIIPSTLAISFYSYQDMINKKCIDDFVWFGFVKNPNDRSLLGSNIKHKFFSDFKYSTTYGLNIFQIHDYMYNVDNLIILKQRKTNYTDKELKIEIPTLKFRAKSIKEDRIIEGDGLSMNHMLNTFSIVNPYADGTALDSYDTIDFINIDIGTITFSVSNITDSFGELIWFGLGNYSMCWDGAKCASIIELKNKSTTKIIHGIPFNKIQDFKWQYDSIKVLGTYN